LKHEDVTKQLDLELGLKSSEQQIPLPLEFIPSFAEEDFLLGASNQKAHRFMMQWPQWPAHALLVQGEAGTGKSHLTHIWAQRAGAIIMPAHDLSDAALDTIERTQPLLIEDADRAKGAETALFHLLNRSQAGEQYLVMTSTKHPNLWHVERADLASRLRLIPSVTLEQPDEDLLKTILMKLFADYQWAPDEAIASYIIQRIPRSLAAARAVMSKLNQETLSRKTKISKPLIQEVLTLLEI
jgi:chromosomal replication initiation ATPase DnaA